MAITQSDTSLRGTQQAVLPTSNKSEKKKNRKPCRCCHNHCGGERAEHHSRASRNSMDESVSTGDNHHNHSSISDLQSIDMSSLNNNNTATSQSITSTLRGVDLPVFEDSQQESPVKNTFSSKTTTNEWEKSPQLGESASVLIEKQRRLEENEEEFDETQEEQEEDNERKTEENLLNNKEFYQQMMAQVQKLIKAQDKDEDEGVEEDEEKSTREEEPIPRHALSPEEKIQHVRDTTVRELEKLIPKNILRDSTKPLEVFEQRQRSMSEITTSSPPSFPKINYKSFVTSVDDTLYDYTSSTIDQIASKYVPREMLLQHQEQREVKNKTVKFEGVYEWQSSNHKGGVINQNMASVNFSCNMSIASKKYLQKYSLALHDEDRLPLKDQNGRQAAADEEDGAREGKENRILDFKKLRSLQKLK